MPLPTPNRGENEDDFIQRCITDDTMEDEYPNPEQRKAVCFRQWEENAKMRTIELSGDVGFEITAEGLKKELGDRKDAVKIKVDSYGGNVFEAVRLYNAIKDYKGKVTAELGAVAASAASFFPLSANTIKVRKNTTYMGHKAWSFAIGNSDDMTAEALILEGLDNIISDTYAKKTGRDKKTILDEMKGDGFWIFGGDDIVANGYADALVDEDEEQDEEPIGQPDVAARLQQVKQRLEQSPQFNDEMRRAAKMIMNEKDTVKEVISALPGEENKQEASMDLKEILEKYPNAKAEIDAKIEKGKAEVKDEFFNKGKEEGAKEAQKRIMSVLDISGVKIPDAAKETIENGGDEKSYAFAELKKQREAQAQAGEQNLGNFKGPETKPADSAPQGAAKKSALELEIERQAKLKKGDK